MENSFVLAAAKRIASTAFQRTARLARTAALIALFSTISIPVVAAQEGGYTQLNTTNHTYADFEAGTVDDTTQDGDKVLADVSNCKSALGIKQCSGCGLRCDSLSACAD